MSLVNQKKPSLSIPSKTTLPPLILPPIKLPYSSSSTLFNSRNQYLDSRRSSHHTLPDISFLLNNPQTSALSAPLQYYSPEAVLLPSSSCEDTEPPKAPRKRKKRECPDCHKLVLNLATHKSTHFREDAKPHVCKECGRAFTRLNDLSRHERRHLKNTFSEAIEDVDYQDGLTGTSKTTIYKCPYWHQEYDTSRKNFPGALCKNGKCHSSGVFSRGDTFKNHLRALHFVYPEGTKKKNRGNVSGHCKSCGQACENADSWLKYHVLNHQCPGAASECAFNVGGL